jgi:hypothetical protein
MAEQILKDPYLLRMYSQNVPVDFSHPKLSPLPIGLENLVWKHQFPKLYSKPSKPFVQRTQGAFLAVNVATHAGRAVAVKALSGKKFVKIITKKVPLNHYLNLWDNSKYVISPRGNGLDCHRTWEALARGCIVVTMKDMSLDLFEGMPVIYVSSWNEIESLEWLEERGKQFVVDGKVRISKPKHLLDYYIKEFEK